MGTLATTVNGLKLPNPFVIGSGPPGTNANVIGKAFDEARVLADDAAGVLFEQILGAAFADAGDAGVGLDRDNDVALVE
jgi:hypothetical protein